MYACSDNCCLQFVSLHLHGCNKVKKEFVSAPILSQNTANLPYTFWVQGEGMLLKQSIEKYLQDYPWQACQATTMHITCRALITGRYRNAPAIDKHIALDHSSNFCKTGETFFFFFTQAKSLVKSQIGFRKTGMLSLYKWNVSDVSA